MLTIIRERLQQGHRTIAYPGGRAARAARSLPRPAGAGRVEVSGRLPGLRRGLPDRRHRTSTARGSGSTWAAACSAPTASTPVPKEPSAITQDYRLATRTPRGPGPSERPGARSWPRPLEEKMRRALRPLAQAPPGQRRRLTTRARPI